MVTQNRGKNVAIIGAVAQTVFTAVVMVLWLWTDSLAAMTCVWLVGGGVASWLMVAVLCYCGQLADQETVEMEEIAAQGEGGTIFQGERDMQVTPAANRVAWMHRWMVPVFTLLWAGFHGTVGVLLVRRLLTAEPMDMVNGAEATLFAVLVAFAGFLFSRYATGMGRTDQWYLLRAPGSYLLVSMLGAAGTAAALLGGHYGYVQIDRIVAFALPGIQLVLAAELLLNFMLDLYRPRVPGRVHHPSFDSRLMNLVAEPGRIGSSIADALNYQFGFEVSKTWFYQLLSRAFVPLIIFGAAVLFGMSSIVMVQEGEQALVLHWGRADAGGRLLGPGMHFKWPWPIDTSRTYDVTQLYEVILGAEEERSEQERGGDFIKGREVYVWKREHGPRKEMDFLIAVPRSEDAAATKDDEKERKKTPPVHIIKLVVSVQYRIADVWKYSRGYTDPRQVLQCVAYREMMRYCASATETEPVGAGETDRPEAIMTYGRQRAADALKERIQKAIGPDGLDLGVEIAYVGFMSVHPPSEAAESYEDVLVAERGMQQARFAAEADANRMLVEAAGDAAVAWELALAIQTLERLENLRNVEGNAAEFSRSLRAYVSDAESQVRKLAEEIEQEVLLGRLGREGTEQSVRQVQRQRYVALLNELREIEQAVRDGGKVNLARRVARARKEADDAFDRTTGQPKVLVAQAEADRWKTELTERAQAESFQRELAAYQASPRVYMLDRQLQVWEEILPDLTKYVLGIDPTKVQHWLNWELEAQHMEGILDQPEGE
jgi:modulator of FtsH protease HflK